MNIGFTGTREGMTDAQKATVAALLEKLGTSTASRVAHHGDCIGADTDFHQLAKEAGYFVVGHPSDLSTRSYCQVDECREVKRPLVRDRDIVDEVKVLLACPKGFKEETRSGTWTTIRHARKLTRPHVIVYPDGTAERFN